MVRNQKGEHKMIPARLWNHGMHDCEMKIQKKRI